MIDNNNELKSQDKTEGKFNLEFLRNIAINLRATGPAAVIIAWIIGIALVGVFGQGEVASKALSALSFAGPMIIIILGQNVR
jgi:hypothetical protein